METRLPFLCKKLCTCKKKRKIKIQLEKYAHVITILGPRQAEKTTLVKELFPDYTYVNLEDRVTRELSENDYEGFFYKFPEPMIIDEVQRVPELLSDIQVKVDEDRRKNGRFILTGSHQPRLREAVAQSLAGRTTIQYVDLCPNCIWKM